MFIEIYSSHVDVNFHRTRLGHPPQPWFLSLTYTRAIRVTDGRHNGRLESKLTIWLGSMRYASPRQQL